MKPRTIFIVSFAAVTAIGHAAASLAGIPPGWAFTAGLAASLPLEYLRDWLIELERARNTAQEVDEDS